MAIDPNRNKRPAAPAPQNREAADALLALIGKDERHLESAKANRDDEIEETKRLYATRMQPAEERLERNRAALQQFCEGRRDELTQNGKRKTVQFGAGKVRWRQRPPSVKIVKPKDVLERLLGMAGKPFVRQSWTINKEALLAKPDKAETIEGVTIVRAHEDFVIEPAKTPDPTPEAVKENAA